MDETSEVAAVLVSQTNGVARIVVSNPAKRNALTLTMKQQLLEAFLRLDGDPGTRCIVVSGAGTKSFISGADISEFACSIALPRSPWSSITPPDCVREMTRALPQAATRATTKPRVTLRSIGFLSEGDGRGLDADDTSTCT